MQAQRRAHTNCELAVRRRLHALGMRYRVDMRPEQVIRRKADIVFTRRRIAVFIDGCFWHGCPAHWRPPRTNTEWWTAKIRTTQERDLQTTQMLAERGWVVLRFWEHDSPDEVVAAICAALTDRP